MHCNNGTSMLFSEHHMAMPFSILWCGYYIASFIDAANVYWGQVSSIKRHWVYWVKPSLRLHEAYAVLVIWRTQNRKERDRETEEEVWGREGGRERWRKWEKEGKEGERMIKK